MKIRLISHHNGVGLSKDVAIVRSILESRGHEVWFSEWLSVDGKGMVDCNIYFELLSSRMLRDARHNFFMPNPEWYEQYFDPHLRGIHAILAKTKDCEVIFNRKKRGRQQVIYTGFTSEDQYDDTIEREFSFGHFSGKSNAKGTEQVVEAFKREGMPQLFVYSMQSRPCLAGKLPENIHVEIGSRSHEKHKQSMNRHLIHLCTSLYEGFGHYINEAKSCAAVIVTTNAPPMNQLAPRDFAFGCEVADYRWQKLARLAVPSVDGIEQMVRIICETDEAVLRKLGQKARQSFLANDALFKEGFVKLIESHGNN